MYCLYCVFAGRLYQEDQIIPEPASLILIGLGIFGLVRRKTRK
ncbi:MAG: PEP-CTERM sorting domain-containing protein [Promethearchaeota archaeon]